VSDRLVLVRVTDPDVLQVQVLGQKGNGTEWDGGWFLVPEDDQLHEDLDLLTTSGRNQITQEAARRLRAAFGLDTEDDNE